MIQAEERTRLEERLGHTFRSPELLETALSHPSFAHETEGAPHNERLEFLGDAVLGLVVADLLYARHPDWREGELTRARAALVNARALATHARSLGLGGHLRLGRTEQRTGGAEKDSILSNVFEAVVGALYLDAGLGAARAFVARELDDALVRAPSVGRDAKTRLQEWAHAQRRATPRYRTLRDSQVDADEERFEVEVWIADAAWARGVGRTKRQAEQAAAERALAQTGEPG